MDLTALLLSRLQFAFTVSFHIIFPSFTIGLAAWLTVLEALYLATGRPTYRVVFEFWLKIFAVAFGLGVVSGIVMGFQFGTNWSVLARASGPIQGPLLSYETFTAFFLEASFFGILLSGRPRVSPGFYLFSTAMVALGTTLSAFWIMVNNSWMQVPTGYVVQNGAFAPDDWAKILFNGVLWVRFPHMLLASYLTGAFCVAATGAWYVLRGKFGAEARIMLRMGLLLAAILVPAQIFFGHILWGAFPVVYATLLSAFYLPLLVMLAGLILRGVAFEFRYKTERMRWIWDAGFAGGSLIAAFIQGMTVGALVEGLPIAGGQYAGGDFGWLSPFALLCGVSLTLGYTLLGAGWLVRKSDREVRDAAYRLIPALAIGLLILLITVFGYALVKNLQVMGRWLERPYLFVFPAIGALAAIQLALSIRRRDDRRPFTMVALIFAAAFGTLAISFWPYMIPFSITVADAAAPHASLAFMFWGEGLFVFPLMLVYAVISYRVFRGKISPTSGHY